jgi:hypothetical protein
MVDVNFKQYFRNYADLRGAVRRGYRELTKAAPGT